MKAVLICRDRPGALALRMETRAAHLDYLAASREVELAGPLLDADGNPAGSLIVLEVADLDAARAWAAADPYAQAGLFASVTVEAWRKVVG